MLATVRLRHNPMTRALIILCVFLLTIRCSPSSAQDYKEAANSAYRVGVLNGTIERMNRTLGTTAASSLASRRDYEQRRLRQVAFVEGALKQQKIDSTTVSKLMSVGEVDAGLCWDGLEKCPLELTKRIENSADPDVSERQFQSCNSFVEPTCTRTNACT